MVRLPQQKRQWTQTKTDYTNQITDDSYQGVVGYHNPIWKYLINHYDGDILCPLNVVGYVAIPLAIEFSQWGFPVTYITDSLEGVKKAEKDCEIHSGKFKDLFYFDFIKDCTPAKVTIFVNILEELDSDEMFMFLDMLLRRSREVVCAVRNDRNWRNLLSGKYSVNVSEYKDKQFCLITLQENV